ncbi:hypothetical protein ONE63_000042 [Megalurothrips usitatus]|uniref:NADH dehydrogenase subunit 5 n=1 Tax=Megalurothrips usitatus TaxID=439358 RepID=A0AAV7Y135_9NEOP|nr:hypothetical protein ONE63_000042 [Megalurothrips usitatus]
MVILIYILLLGASFFFLFMSCLKLSTVILNCLWSKAVCSRKGRSFGMGLSILVLLTSFVTWELGKLFCSIIANFHFVVLGPDRK